jgi:hypothetical protein
MGYKLIYTRQAEKDATRLEQAGLERTAKDLLFITLSIS